MVKRILFGVMISLFGASGVGYAQIKFKYPNCPPCGAEHGARGGVKNTFWLNPNKCVPSATCGAYGLCEKDLFGEEETNAIIENTITAVEGQILLMEDAQGIALEMADVNPWAAWAFFGIYNQSKPGGWGLREKSEFTGEQSIDSSSINAEKVKRIVNVYHAKKDMEAEKFEVLSQGNETVRVVYETRKTASDGAVLEIRIFVMDSEFNEKGRILPDVRVKLRKVKNDEDTYWRSVGWEY